MAEVLLFIHIVCAAIWFGGGIVSIILLNSALKLKGQQTLAIVTNLANLGKFVFGPVSLLVFISGAGLVSVLEREFSELWITLSMTGIIISILIGALGHSRAGRKAVTAAQSQDEQATTKAIKAWLTIAYIDAAIIASVIALMVFKPGV